MILSHTKSYKIAITGILGALALALAYLEGLLPPFPMLPPGAKPGFSNIVTMFAADFLGLLPAVFIGIIKGFFTLITRGVTAGLMSLMAGVISGAAMAALFKHTVLSYLMIGIIGAVLHNTTQLIVSLLLIGSAMAFYFPTLLLFALVSGSLTGLITGLALKRAKRLLGKGDSIEGI